MKLLPLVWAALRRNRAESILTLVALSVGFTLIGVMVALNAAYQRAIDDMRMDRVIISCAFDCGNLPSGYAEPIARIPVSLLSAANSCMADGNRTSVTQSQSRSWTKEFAALGRSCP